ncbi:MAG: histidine triad nucleotide-binding protein [Dongiaceae bacterium]
MPYDHQNVFARILRGELPCRKVYEDKFVLAFHDINPKAPTHVVVIPKGHYMSMDDFAAHGKEEELFHFLRAVNKIAVACGTAETGYRLIANNGIHGGQEVPHAHMHVLGGKPLGQMIQ